MSIQTILNNETFNDKIFQMAGLDQSSQAFINAKQDLIGWIKKSGFQPSVGQLQDLRGKGIDFDVEVGRPSGSLPGTPFATTPTSPSALPPAPPQIPDSQPNTWAQTGMIGGVPLLTSIALGISVEEGVAGLFGQDSASFTSFYNSQTPEMKKSIDILKSHLTTIKNSLDIRRNLLKEMTDNYPHIVAQNLKQVSDTLGPQIDSISRQFMSRTADDLAAKYNTRGGFSSGGFNEALSKSAADLALQKQQFLQAHAEQMYSQRYAEATSAFDFQKKMLGQVDVNIFNANQNALDRQAQIDRVNKQFDFSRETEKNRSTRDLFRSFGTLGGMFLPGAASKFVPPVVDIFSDLF